MSYYDYEDIYTEPSEADKIIDEAKDKLNNLFLDSVKSDIEQAKKLKEELEKLQSDAAKAKYDLSVCQQQLEKAKKDADEAESNIMPQKYINKFVSKYTGGFAPNDKVWIINNHTSYEKCECCNGTGKIKATVGAETVKVNCPKCYGGKKQIITKEAEEKYIGRVDLRLCFDDDNRVSAWATENIYLREYDFALSPKGLYKTKEEAEKAIEQEKKNK